MLSGIGTPPLIPRPERIDDAPHALDFGLRKGIRGQNLLFAMILKVAANAHGLVIGCYASIDDSSADPAAWLVKNLQNYLIRNRWAAPRQTLMDGLIGFMSRPSLRFIGRGESEHFVKEISCTPKEAGPRRSHTSVCVSESVCARAGRVLQW